MAHIVIMGAGLGGLPAAYELRSALPEEHRVTVVSAVDYFQFVPSNPWIAVGWRKRDEITVDLAPTMAKKGINFIATAAERLHPGENRRAMPRDCRDRQPLQGRRHRGRQFPPGFPAGLTVPRQSALHRASAPDGAANPQTAYR